MDDVIECLESGKKLTIARYPVIGLLVPVLLDRGDPLGRETAMRVAKSGQSPRMLDALKAFAFGSRGPDSLRFEALFFLRNRKIIDAGPHLVYRSGARTNVQLLAAEITNAPRPSNSSARVLKLLESGFYSMQNSDCSKADSAFAQALAAEPDNCSAAYNLCGVWSRRDGAKGERKALPRLEQLHKEHPDYPFAAIALAQDAARRGDFQPARDLLSPYLNAKQLHTTKAIALLSAQAQIALEEKDIDAAERAFAMLWLIADENDPLIKAVRYRIDRSSVWKKLRELISW